MKIKTVLVVEDEPELRKLIIHILRKHGYYVLEAESGEEGVSVAVKFIERIDLLISDFSMPRITGPDLFKRLLPVRPDLRVIYLSGYPEKAVDQTLVTVPGHPFLEKPFAMEDLLKKVKQVLT